MPVTPPSDERPPLDEQRLAAQAPPGLVIEVLDEVGSTNQVAAERARSGAGEVLVVVAEHQSAGRGRLDRTWEAPPRAALTFSVLLRPEASAASWPWLPLLTGYAVVKALRAEGFDAGVKWPNDVLIAEQKVAGLLAERVETPRGPAAILGIGLNVDLQADELPVPTATSLTLIGGRRLDRTSLLLTVLETLREAYDSWQAGGEAAAARLRESYAAACVTLGRSVRVDLPGGEALHGTATGIDVAGRLVVSTGSGERTVAAGDVVHVRTT